MENKDFTTDMTVVEAEANYDEALGEILHDGNNMDAAQELGSAAMTVRNAKLKETIEDEE